MGLEVKVAIGLLITIVGSAAVILPTIVFLEIAAHDFRVFPVCAAVGGVVIMATVVSAWLSVTRWIPSILEKGVTPSSHDEDHPTVAMVVLPVLLSLIVTALGNQLHTNELSLWLGIPAVAFAVAYNGIPGHVRQHKYIALFSAMLITDPSFVVWTLAILAFIVVNIVGVRVTKSCNERGEMSRASRKLFQLSIKLSDERARLVFVLIVAPFVVIQLRAQYEVTLGNTGAVDVANALSILTSMILLPPWVALILRYHLKDAAARRPILYLRSFSDNSVNSRLKRLLAPLTRTAVIRCLVHPKQRAAAIQRGLPASQFIRANYADDLEWRSWVASELAACSGVIFDFVSGPPTDATGLKWEYELATAKLDPDRIAVLVSDATGSLPKTQLHVVHVERHDSLVRQELANWADSGYGQITTIAA